MELTSVLIKPYHTEKTNRLRLGQQKSCISFIVNNKATKNDVLMAFKAIYNVTPEKINILNRKSQSFRNGTRVPGRTKQFKLAFVILPMGVSIALTKAEIEEVAKQNETKIETKESKKEAKKLAKEAKKQEKAEKKKAKQEEVESK